MEDNASNEAKWSEIPLKLFLGSRVKREDVERGLLDFIGEDEA
jgi:hypothetical protein